jgi:hypothetical protein
VILPHRRAAPHSMSSYRAIYVCTLDRVAMSGGDEMDSCI